MVPCWCSCCCSVTQLCPTLCNPMNCSTLGFPVLHYLPEFAQTHANWVGDAIQPPHSLSSPSHPVLSLSQHQGLFQWVGSSYQVAKVLELQHQSFQWIFRIISFRIHWLDLLTVQGTLRTLLQHHSSKASILWRSAFFRVQLSHPYMTTGKTIALSIRTFVSKAMSLLFNTLSKFVIAFLPRSKCLLTSRLQSPPVVILESKKIKSVIVSTFLFCVHLSSIKETSRPLLLFYFLNLMQNLSWGLTLWVEKGILENIVPT